MQQIEKLRITNDGAKPGGLRFCGILLVFLGIPRFKVQLMSN